MVWVWFDRTLVREPQLKAVIPDVDSFLMAVPHDLEFILHLNVALLPMFVFLSDFHVCRPAAF